MIRLDKVREELLQRTKQLSKEDIQQKSECICNTIVSILPKKGVLGFYMAMPNEVQLATLLQVCWQNYLCAVPITKAKGIMDFYVVDARSNFQKGTYGILEPQHAELLTRSLDVILVPMVGFDEQLHRIGHGAGYYDRYLAEKDCMKIGIAFACQRCDTIVPQPHDIDMDMIITENRIYKKDEHYAV